MDLIRYAKKTLKEENIELNFANAIEELKLENCGEPFTVSEL